MVDYRKYRPQIIDIWIMLLFGVTLSCFKKRRNRMRSFLPDQKVLEKLLRQDYRKSVN